MRTLNEVLHDLFLQEASEQLPELKFLDFQIYFDKRELFRTFIFDSWQLKGKLIQYLVRKLSLVVQSLSGSKGMVTLSKSNKPS